MEEKSKASRKLRRTIIFLIGLFAIFSVTVTASTITSTFDCTNKGGETTLYTYLKTSEVKESPYSRGLSTGSLTYLKGGDAHVTDTQTYHDGKVDSSFGDANASVKHDLTVRFSGQKGESLYYAKGYYTNNRGISASKKIWFVDFTNDKWIPQSKKAWFVNNTYLSNNINVDAITSMNMKGTYDMTYGASANNSYFVFNDASGWSNKTGSRRIDWEQEGLIKGNLNVTNNLYLESEYIAREGPIEDWLPCICEKSSVLGYPYPPIEPVEGSGSEWPSQGIYDTLNDRSPKEILEGLSPYISLPQKASGAGQVLKTPDILAESFYSVTGDGADYTINVRNTGTSDLTNVKLVAELVPNIDYVPSSARINDRPQEPIPIQTSNGTSLMWTLGDLKPVTGPDGLKTVSMKMIGTKNATNFNDLMVYAIYTKGNKETSTVPVPSQGAVSTEPF